MSACRATSPGRAGPSTPASGRHRSQVRAGCAGSTSMATARAILAGHGGEHRAVFVYQIESYRYWQEHLGRSNLVHGQFGENFTVEGLADTNVCIGDRYRIGSALFEVTQPRVTCYRLGIRMDEPDMAALLVRHGRPGFYFRVIEEGDVEAGDEIMQVAAGPERMSVFEINALLYMPPHPRDRLERALRIPALSRGWQRSFEALLEQQTGQQDRGKRRAWTVGEPSSRLARIPLLSRGAQDRGKRQRDVADPRARRWTARCGRPARSVRRRTARPALRADDAQLFAVAPHRRRVLSHQHQAGDARRRQRSMSPTSSGLATSSSSARHAAVSRYDRRPGPSSC